MPRSLLKLLPLLVLTAVPAVAQYENYTVPGSLAERRIRTQDEIRQSYLDARWRIGFLHLDPRLAITDLGYVSNIYGTAEARAESDLKAQGVAGLRGFFHLGPKVLVSPFADVGYTWWQDQSDLRSLNESYGVQVLGDFNRLQVMLQAGEIGTQRNLSSELEVPVDVRNQRYELSFQIDIRGPLSFFGAAATGQSRYFGEEAIARIPQLDLAARNVDTDVLSAGIGYEFGSGWRIDLGFESIDARFVTDPGGRSNRGAGPLLRIALEGSRLLLDVDAVLRDLEFDGRTEFGDRRQLVGEARLGWQFTERLSASVFTGTQLDFSGLNRNAVFESRRAGVALQHQTGARSSVAAFYEAGEDEFARVVDDEVTRIDDLTSFGLRYRFRLAGRAELELAFTNTVRESTDPDFDRDLTWVTTRIRVGGNLLPW